MASVSGRRSPSRDPDLSRPHATHPARHNTATKVTHDPGSPSNLNDSFEHPNPTVCTPRPRKAHQRLARGIYLVPCQHSQPRSWPAALERLGRRAHSRLALLLAAHVDISGKSQFPHKSGISHFRNKVNQSQDDWRNI